MDRKLHALKLVIQALDLYCTSPILSASQARGRGLSPHRPRWRSSVSDHKSLNCSLTHPSLMIIREIVEKPTGSAPPPPPQPPKASSKGFPIAARRPRPQSSSSSTSSAAAGPSRPRREPGENVPERFASLDLSGPGLLPHKQRTKLSETDEIRRSADAENQARVEGMSEEERVAESQELLDRFGSGLAALMRKRREQRESGPSQGKSAGAGAQSQNKAGVDGASEGYRDTTARQQSSSNDPDDDRDQPPHKRTELTPNPSELKEKYFPNTRSEDDKLAWLRAPTPSRDTSTRFDLSGRVLSPAEMDQIPTTAGLHHHGTSPDLAGYTIDDILWLSRSTVPSQRITMLGVLSRIIAADLAGSLDNAAKEEVDKSGARGKAVDMTVDILLTTTRSIGIVRAGADLLYASLGLDSWNGDSARYIPDASPHGLESIPFDELLPRIAELLGKNSALPPASVHQLLTLIRRATCTTQDLAESIAPFVPKIVRERVFQCPWPLEVANLPLLDALELLRETVESSRTSADHILDADLVQSLLKYLVVSSWPDDATLAEDLATQSMEIIASLGRYGLSASLATSATDIFRGVGQHIKEPSSGVSPRFVAAYFRLLEVWTTCAIDPHKTTPEHALTWAQVSALGWIDEALDLVPVFVQAEQWAQLSATLGLLNAWVVGASVNEPQGGQAEKERMTAHLRESGLASVCESTTLAQLLRLDRELGSSILDTESRASIARQYLEKGSSPELRYQCLLSSGTGDWLKNALPILGSFQPGSEPEALDLLDHILKCDFTSFPTISQALQSITHADRLEILRPLFHYAILPSATHVVGPDVPSHLYLKPTTTLRRPPSPSPDEKREAGLPLPSDWVFTPLNELLSSSDSAAITQAPLDWSPSELDIVRATLILAQAQMSVDPTALSRSSILLNAIKVFMLEHDQSNAAPGQEGEAFRDDSVSASLCSLVGPTTVPSPDLPPSSLEEAATAFLGAEVPFFQFYTDFVALYQAISFSNPTFSQLVLPPLAMGYAVDYRRLVWVEHSSSLRSIRTPLAEVPLENGRIDAYLRPAEVDRDVLAGYTQALVRGWVSKRQPALFRIATVHLASLFWTEESAAGVQLEGQKQEKGKEVEKGGEVEEAGPSRLVVRKNLLRAIISNGPQEAIKEIVTVDLQNLQVEGRAEEEEIKRRLDLLETEGGPTAKDKVARIIA